MEPKLEEMIQSILSNGRAEGRTCLHRGDFGICEAQPHQMGDEDFTPHLHVVHMPTETFVGCTSEEALGGLLFAGWLFDTGRLNEGHEG